MPDDTKPPKGERSDLECATDARLYALGNFVAYLMRRLGAPEPLVLRWLGEWRVGDLYRLCAVQNEIEETIEQRRGRKPT